MSDQQQAAAVVGRWPWNEAMAKFVRYRRLSPAHAELKLLLSQVSAFGHRKAAERLYSDYMIRRMTASGGDGW